MLHLATLALLATTGFARQLVSERALLAPMMQDCCCSADGKTCLPASASKMNGMCQSTVPMAKMCSDSDLGYTGMGKTPMMTNGGMMSSNSGMMSNSNGAMMANSNGAMMPMANSGNMMANSPMMMPMSNMAMTPMMPMNNMAMSPMAMNRGMSNNGAMMNNMGGMGSSNMGGSNMGGNMGVQPAAGAGAGAGAGR